MSQCCTEKRLRGYAFQGLNSTPTSRTDSSVPLRMLGGLVEDNGAEGPAKVAMLARSARLVLDYK